MLTVYLEICLDHHQVVLGGGQYPLAIICDNNGDGPSQSLDGCHCFVQTVRAIQSDAAVF